MDNLGFQKELEVIHSRLFEILGYIFQKYRPGADSARHIYAGSSPDTARTFITQSRRPATWAPARLPVVTPGEALNHA